MATENKNEFRPPVGTRGFIIGIDPGEVNTGLAILRVTKSFHGETMKDDEWNIQLDFLDTLQMKKAIQEDPNWKKLGVYSSYNEKVQFEVAQAVADTTRIYIGALACLHSSGRVKDKTFLAGAVEQQYNGQVARSGTGSSIAAALRYRLSTPEVLLIPLEQARKAVGIADEFKAEADRLRERRRGIASYANVAKGRVPVHVNKDRVYKQMIEDGKWPNVPNQTNHSHDALLHALACLKGIIGFEIQDVNVDNCLGVDDIKDVIDHVEQALAQETNGSTGEDESEESQEQSESSSCSQSFGKQELQTQTQSPTQSSEPSPEI